MQPPWPPPFRAAHRADAAPARRGMALKNEGDRLPDLSY
jgi:hypothetical protein